MTVEELITKLSQYPYHYTVKALLVLHPCANDQTADFVDVTNCGFDKIVNLELDGPLET